MVEFRACSEFNVPLGTDLPWGVVLRIVERRSDGRAVVFGYKTRDGRQFLTPHHDARRTYSAREQLILVTR